MGKIIQAEVPLVTAIDETETFRLLLLRIINHSTYGTAAEHMFPTNLPETVEKARGRLETRTLLVTKKTSETLYRGLPGPNPNGLLPDNLYQSISNILYHGRNRLDANTKQSHNDKKHNMRRGTGRTIRGKGKRPDQHGLPKLESKFNLHSVLVLPLSTSSQPMQPRLQTQSRS